MILLHVIKDFGDKKKNEEEIIEKKNIKVWKLNLKHFLTMFGFGENPNFA